jgi:3-oxoacyl-[acyl-carrier-protein] synthase-3
MHTGSRRILDGLCDRFGIAPNSEAVASSYRVLRDFGNTLGCSVPLMLADPEMRPAGEGVVVAFGLSFSCGAFSVKFPPGGWSSAPEHTCRARPDGGTTGSALWPGSIRFPEGGRTP